ncbi:MAG: 16S rRNA (guanine527-N7)-methyltransferase, partial [Paracoccaceae bacterium]
QVFTDLLGKWNPHINLVSRNSLADVWERHIADSIHVFRVAPVVNHWVDLGSGGGFPGMVVAILAMDEAPDIKTTLVESDQRKATFLRTAARETGAPCTVISDRSEAVPPQEADVLSARALADLSDLLHHAERHLASGGTALFPKGVTWQKEVDAAQRQWRFEVEAINSLTKPGAAILKITGVSRV